MFTTKLIYFDGQAIASVFQCFKKQAKKVLGVWREKMWNNDFKEWILKECWEESGANLKLLVMNIKLDQLAILAPWKSTAGTN